MCGRVAVLNSARLVEKHQHRLYIIQKKVQKGQKKIKQDGTYITAANHFLAQQVGLLNPHAGAHYLASLSARAPPCMNSNRHRAFSTTSFSKNSDATSTTSTTPYVPFGTNQRPDNDDDEYEWIDEVWEVRTFSHTGREYIYNRTTHEIRPAEEALGGSTDKNKDILLQYEPPMVTVKRRDNDEDEQRELRWEEHTEIRGDRLPYFLNRATGECTWKFPFEDPSLVPEFPIPQPYNFMRVSNIQDLPSAPLFKRLSAAALDFAITISATGAYSAVMYYEMGPKCVPGIAILMFVAYSWRDGVLDQGSRSIGKKMMGLEIVKEKDGSLPGRFETVGRSCYFISYYGMLALGVFEAPQLLYIAGGLLLTDVGLLVVKGKRIGDYGFGTKVIEVQELREERVKDRTDYLLAESNAA